MDAFCAATGQARATVARKAAGDWRFFDRLDGEKGSSFLVQKYDAVMDWFAGNWPADCPQPNCLQDHVAVRQWESSNSYSCALENGAPVPRVVSPAANLPGQTRESEALAMGPQSGEVL